MSAEGRRRVSMQNPVQPSRAEIDDHLDLKEDHNDTVIFEHTAKGAMSGALGKKLGFVVNSAKEDPSNRVYGIEPVLVMTAD